MFDFVRSNSRLVHIFLFLVGVPTFGLMGLQGYSRFISEESAAVAVVDGRNISRAEWDELHKKQVERIRQQAPNVDVAMFDTPTARYQTLKSIVRERVLAAVAKHQNLILTDAQLQQDLMSIPELAKLRKADGSFDIEGYRNLLQGVGLTPETFEADYRQNAASQRVLAAIDQTTAVASSLVAVSFQAQAQERWVQLLAFSTGSFLPQAQATEPQLKQYYEKNKADFRTPEQADIQYVVLDSASVKSGLEVTEEAISKSYDDNKARYNTSEERKASHILIKAEKTADAEVKAKAKAKAESLLVQIRKTPAKFAELARTQSEDPGSAAKGGDLDFFGRGAMVKPFEDAAFAMKVGEISELVESDFGFHIIRLDAIKPASVKPLSEVRAEIESTLKDELAKKRYSEWSEQFTNMVYEQSDSLDAVVKKFHLNLQTATVNRRSQTGAQGVLASGKFLDAVFTEDVTRNKRNTDAIEIAANELAAARVIAYKPSVIPPFEEVKAQIEIRLRTQLARDMAVKVGQEKLSQLQKVPSLDGFEGEIKVSRDTPIPNQPKILQDAVLKANISTLPVLKGVDLGDAGYAIVRINKVEAPDLSSKKAQQYQEQWLRDWTAAESALYYNVLKRRFKVKINVPEPSKDSI